jgi:hypothetical protein
MLTPHPHGRPWPLRVRDCWHVVAILSGRLRGVDDVLGKLLDCFFEPGSAGNGKDLGGFVVRFFVNHGSHCHSSFPSKVPRLRTDITDNAEFASKSGANEIPGESAVKDNPEPLFLLYSMCHYRPNRIRVNIMIVGKPNSISFLDCATRADDPV